MCYTNLCQVASCCHLKMVRMPHTITIGCQCKSQVYCNDYFISVTFQIILYGIKNQLNSKFRDCNRPRVLMLSCTMLILWYRVNRIFIYMMYHCTIILITFQNDNLILSLHDGASYKITKNTQATIDKTYIFMKCESLTCTWS